jgi:hypothetical protein
MEGQHHEQQPIDDLPAPATAARQPDVAATDAPVDPARAGRLNFGPRLRSAPATPPSVPVALPDPETVVDAEPSNRGARDVMSDLRDDLLADALVRGATQTEAAAELGISTKTVSRRLHDPRFRARLRDRLAAERAAMDARRAMLEDEAVGTLRELNAVGPPPVRCRAALGLLDYAASGRDADVEAQIDQAREDLEALSRAMDERTNR